MSIVRENLLKRKGYTPYCGDSHCKFRMPRTVFKDGQFQCICGYRTDFEPEFIKQVEDFNKTSEYPDSPYKPGDPAPQGYVAWHEWATIQNENGIFQTQCETCKKFYFPQEIEGHKCEPRVTKPVNEAVRKD